MKALDKIENETCDIPPSSSSTFEAPIIPEMLCA